MKDSTVSARVETNIKIEAEDILQKQIFWRSEITSPIRFWSQMLRWIISEQYVKRSRNFLLASGICDRNR